MAYRRRKRGTRWILEAEQSMGQTLKLSCVETGLTVCTHRLPRLAEGDVLLSYSKFGSGEMEDKRY